jgi:peptidoglycan hydrolase FlgJ
MDANIQSAMMMAQQAPIVAPQATNNAEKAGKVAKEFEGVFISQFLGSMFSGIKADSEFGGGEGEEMFRSLMVDQYGKQMETRGGFGLAAAVQRQLLKHQGSNIPNSASGAAASYAATSAMTAPQPVTTETVQ